MVKIKTIKKLNLPQLIEYAWDNGVRNVTFRGLDKKGYVVSISINDKGEFSSDWRISKNVIFEVQVEEELTEDTVIPKMLEISLDKERGINLTDIYYNQSINDLKSDSKFGYETLALHVINDDCTHTLIWTSEKGLVE